MDSRETKFYVIINGKLKNKAKKVIITDNKKKALKIQQLGYTTFNDLKSALIFIEEQCGINCKPKMIFDNMETYDIKKNKICPVCKKPHGAKTQACTICHRNKKIYKISIAKILYLQERYSVDDIWVFIKKNHANINLKEGHIKGMGIKRDSFFETQSYHYQLGKYTKWEGDFPPYIKELFNNHPTKEFLTLSGSFKNPNIHYVCKSCNEEHVTTLKSFNKGHDCISTKSSGEVIIESFLKEKYLIKSQFDTLKCINPVTGRQLPYDIEVPELKLIIEIHGQQHYQFIEYFHKNYEDFEYQLFKDNLKESFAIEKGYSFLTINYSEIMDKSFRKKINTKINEIKNTFS